MNQLEEFNYTIKSPQSKTTYQRYFKYFSEFSQIAPKKLFEQYEQYKKEKDKEKKENILNQILDITLMNLLKLKPKKVEELLIQYVIYMRDKREIKLSYSTVNGRISPIITFLELNDLTVNKRKIKKFYGENRRTIKDEAYTTTDIEAMLSVSKLRTKVMILIYSSTGIRRDAIINIKLKHLEKIEEYDLYKITVYENSKEEYITYTTPECASMIDLYLKHREQSGEVINKESYLIRNDYDPTIKDASVNPKAVVSINLTTVFRRLLIKVGLRQDHQPQHERREKSMFHAFRKRFNTILANSSVNHLHKELLLGHSVGLDSSYYRGTDSELLKEYLKAVDNLTINDEARLKKQVKVLEVQNSQYESLKKDFEKFRAEMLKRRK